MRAPLSWASTNSARRPQTNAHLTLLPFELILGRTSLERGWLSPSCFRACGSYSSASRPTSLRSDSRRSKADERLGGGFFLGGSAESGYNLPGSSLTRNSAARSICQVPQQCFSKVREISSGSWLTAALQHSKQLNW